MELYRKALDHYQSDLKKVFFYSLNDEYNGERCVQEIQQRVNRLKRSEIESIALNIPNSIDWIFWYIAADCACKNIYLISSDFSGSLVENIILNYQIDGLVSLEDNNVCFKRANKNIKNSFLDTQKRLDIIFTSGTTGLPKGVVIKEESFFHVANELIKETKQTFDDLELLSMPMDRSFGLARLRTCLISGCSAVVTDGLKDFPSIFGFSRNIPITGLSLVPSALQVIILQLRKKAKLFTENIKYFELGSSSLIDGQEEWIKENFKDKIVIHHYGMTECSRAFLKRLDIERNLIKNYVGFPLNGLEFKINYQNDNVKEGGELLLKGKNLFLSYLNKGDTDLKFENGWFKTGDICFEENGNIFLIGRSDNQINIGGAKVQAEKVEKIFESINHIEECTCFEVTDKIFGSNIAVLVRLSKDITNLKNEVDQAFNGLPAYYRPRRIKIVDSIPKTFNGKKQRDKNILTELLE